MEKIRAKSRSGILYRIYDDLPYLGGCYSIEYAKTYPNGFVCWARPEDRSGRYRYQLTSDYTKVYAQFLSLINS